MKNVKNFLYFSALYVSFLITTSNSSSFQTKIDHSEFLETDIGLRNLTGLSYNLEPLIDKPLLLTRRKRKKRFIQWVSNAFCHLSILLVIPVSLILPILPNWLSSKTSRFRRDLIEDSYNEEEFDDNPVHKRHMEKIISEFDILKIQGISCKERVICEMAADPQKYFPISEMILPNLKSRKLSHVADLKNQIKALKMGLNSTRNDMLNKSLFRMFSKAAEDGTLYGEKKCKFLFQTKCPISLDEHLNMKILNFWGLIYKITGFEVKGFN